ncbi:MAG TPA: aspartyl protease family protein, partial [Thermoanaerobaculia bacterium]|nr:aspartyl protease family protein [Thermoanaerobaculia bacterium]
MRSNLFPRLASLIPILVALVASAQAPPRLQPPGVLPGSASLPPFCIPVTIGSEGPFLFGFDTGASRTTVTPELVKSLKLPVTGSAQITDASDSVHHTVAAVRLPALETLGHGFAAHTAVVVQSTEQGCPRPVSGTLGLGLFPQFLLTLDLQAGSVALARGSLSEEDPHTVTYQVHPALPMVKIAVGPVLLHAGVDSGLQSALSFPASRADELPLGPVLATGRMRTVAGEFSFKQARLYGTLVLGGNDVPA